MGLTPLSTMSKRKPKPITSWAVLPLDWPDYDGKSKPRRRVKVVLCFDGQPQLETSGRVAWLNCQALAAQYNRAGILPRPAPQKVLADYPTEAARAKAARRSDRMADTSRARRL